MVKIPTIQASTLPAVTTRPGVAGREARAWQHLGHEGQRLALTISQQAGELMRRKKALAMALTLSEVGVDIKTGAKDISLALQKKPDWRTHTGFAEVEFDEMVAQRLTTITDPETLARAKVAANQVKTNFLIAEKGYADLLFISDMTAGRVRVMDKFARAKDLEGGYKFIDTQVKGGILDAAAGEKEKLDHRDTVNLVEVRTGINENPSEDNVERLLREFPIPPKQAVLLRERAEMLRKKREGEESDARINAAYQELQAKYGTEYGLMMERTKDPEWQKEHGLDVKEKNSLEGYIRNDEADMEFRYREKQEEFLLKLDRGTLTKEEVLASDLPATRFAQGDKDWFLDEIEKRKIRPYVTSNPEVHGSVLMDVVLNPGRWDKEKIFSYMGKVDDEGNPVGLSIKHATQVWGIWEGLQSGDPAIAKKYGNLALALGRLESYHDLFYFIEPKKEDVSKEEYLLNDQLHYVAQTDLLEKHAAGKDPFVAIEEIMKEYVDKKTASWIERAYRWVVPSPPPPAKAPIKVPVIKLSDIQKDKTISAIEVLKEKNTPAEEIRRMMREEGIDPKDFESYITGE